MDFLSRAITLWKALQVALVIVAAVAWFTSMCLWMHYDSTRSHTPEPTAGRIYRLETHGSIVYLTRSEEIILYALMTTGIICFVVAVGVDVYKQPYRQS